LRSSPHESSLDRQRRSGTKWSSYSSKNPGLLCQRCKLRLQVIRDANRQRGHLEHLRFKGSEALAELRQTQRGSGSSYGNLFPSILQVLCVRRVRLRRF
jgi:hypothetical protein